MGITQQEPPLSPPELLPSQQAIWNEVYSSNRRSIQSGAPALIKSILTSGSGCIFSASSLGFPVTYNAADLWDMILSDQDSADLALLAGLALSPDDAQLRLRAAAFLLPQIARFVVTHADRTANLMANQEFSVGARHV